MKVFEYRLVNAGNMGSSITSAPQQLTEMAMACIQAVFTGTPNGTFKLQVSTTHKQDAQGNIITEGTWTDYTGSSQAIVAAGDFAWNLSTTPYPFVRLVYTRSSGTGTLNVTINGKGV